MNTQYVFLKRESIPNRAALQADIDRLGYDLQLDEELSFFEDEGFSPCTLEGRENVGFEVMCDGLNRDEEDDALLEIAADNDYCISMSWGGDFGDMVCVLIASLALLRDYGGVVSYEGEDSESSDSLVNGIEEGLKAFRNSEE